MEKHEKLLKLSFIATAVLFTAAFVLFAFLRMQGPAPLDADLDEIADALTEAGCTDALEPGNALRVKNAYGLEPSDYEEMLYYYPVNHIDVDEILLLRLPEGAETDAAVAAINDHVEREKNIFENYGTDQFSLLNEAVVYENAPYVLYCAGHKGEASARLVREMIER